MPKYSLANDWGGNSISRSLFLYLEENLPEGKTILELGSGWGTDKLAEKWNVWSVEDEAEWAGKYNDQYFEVPLKKHCPITGLVGDSWYDPGILAIYLEDFEYDLLLVDGPYDYRAGFLKYLYLFKDDVPIVFDDVRRVQGLALMEAVSEKLGRPCEIRCEGSEMFGVIE